MHDLKKSSYKRKVLKIIFTLHNYYYSYSHVITEDEMNCLDDNDRKHIKVFDIFNGQWTGGQGKSHMMYSF